MLTNKYAEGYPGRRYYGGCEEVDKAEQLAIDRACKLFNCAFANVQPHSGAQANQAVFMALLQPGDKFMGMALDQGGHLTHGSPANQSGKWFKVVSYGVKPDDHLIDYEQMEAAGAPGEAQADRGRRLGLLAPSSTGRASARSPTRSAPSSWSTWRTMPAWSPPASIPARCRTPMS